MRTFLTTLALVAGMGLMAQDADAGKDKKTPEERAALDKPATGVIALRGFISGELFVIELTDDGRGIDWARVAARAVALGVPLRHPG